MLGPTVAKMKGDEIDEETMGRFKAYARAMKRRQVEEQERAEQAEARHAAPAAAAGPPGPPAPPPPKPESEPEPEPDVATEPDELPAAERLRDVAQIWRHPSIVSMFLDPVVSAQDPEFPLAALSDGEYPQVLDFQRRLLASVMHEREALLPSFGAADLARLESTMRCLDRANHTALWLERVRYEILAEI